MSPLQIMATDTLPFSIYRTFLQTYSTVGPPGWMTYRYVALTNAGVPTVHITGRRDPA
jgi:hypothetical protein